MQLAVLGTVDGSCCTATLWLFNYLPWGSTSAIVRVLHQAQYRVGILRCDAQLGFQAVVTLVIAMP
jgi:hypothetical protein